MVSYLEGLKDPWWLRTHLLGINVMELFLMFVRKKGMKSFSLSKGKSQASHQVRQRGVGGEEHL